MPTTIAGALVLLLALLPGALGGFFYQRFAGRDWREKDWQIGLRYLALSVAGLAIYALPARAFGWPPPVHVIPSEYENLRGEQVAQFAVPFLGHVIGSVIAGIGAGFGLRAVAWIGGFSAQSSAWDTFAKEYIQGRYVILTLKTGDVYAGYLAIADMSVDAKERDLVLRSPARYDEEQATYLGSGYRDIFISADIVESIATVATGSESKQTAYGQPLFENTTDEQPSENTAASAALPETGKFSEKQRGPAPSRGTPENAAPSASD